MNSRSTGITILAILFGLEFLGGIGISYVMTRSDNYGSMLFAFISLLYGITALITAIGLWLQKKWSFLSYIIWACNAVLFILMFQLEIAQLPILKFLIAIIFFGSILYGIGFYVKRTIKPEL